MGGRKSTLTHRLGLAGSLADLEALGASALGMVGCGCACERCPSDASSRGRKEGRARGPCAGDLTRGRKVE